MSDFKHNQEDIDESFRLWPITNEGNVEDCIDAAKRRIFLQGIEYSRKKYEISQADEDNLLKLQCLEGAGVDNWSGYSYAMDMYRDAKAEMR